MEICIIMLFFLKQQIININYYSGQSNNLWVEFKSGHSGVAQGFQLTVLSVQGEDLWILKSKYRGLLFRGAWISCGRYHQHRGHCLIWLRQGGWKTLSWGQDSALKVKRDVGNSNNHETIPQFRLLLLLNPSYQTQPLQHKDVIQSNFR